ncbi:MAG: hypothetical protein WA419_10375 [Silvibacterium sp.]
MRIATWDRGDVPLNRSPAYPPDAKSTHPVRTLGKPKREPAAGSPSPSAPPTAAQAMQQYESFRRSVFLLRGNGQREKQG